MQLLVKMGCTLVAKLMLAWPLTVSAADAVRVPALMSMNVEPPKIEMPSRPPENVFPLTDTLWMPLP